MKRRNWMTKITKLFVRAAVIAMTAPLLSLSLGAQDLLSLNYWAYGDDGDAPSRTDSGLISVNGSTLEWRWNTPSGTGAIFGYQLPMPNPRSVQNLYTHTILLSGRDLPANKGFLLHLRFDPVLRQIEELSRTEFDGIDPIDFAYNRAEDRLYIWDGEAKVIRTASWSGGMLPAQSLYVPILSSLFAPALDDPLVYGMQVGHDGLGIDLIPEHPDALSGMGTVDFPRVRVHQVGSGWEHFEYSLYDPDAVEDAGYAVLDRMDLSTNEALRIKGPGGPFLVLDVTNSEAVIFQGSLPANPDWFRTDDDDLSTWHEVGFGELQLIPGHEYRITNGSQSFESMPLFPILRYGKPQSTTVGTSVFSLTTGDLNSWGFTIGSEESLVTEVYTDKKPFGAVSYSSFLWWGLRDPSGADPVMFLGGDSWLLNPQGSLGPFQHSIVADFDRGQPVVDFNGPITGFLIPDDEALAGNVVLFQWIIVFSPGGEAVISDVFGSTVLPVAAAEGEQGAQPSGIVSGGSASLGPKAPSQDSYGMAKKALLSAQEQSDLVTSKSIVDALRAKIMEGRR